MLWCFLFLVICRAVALRFGFGGLLCFGSLGLKFVNLVFTVLWFGIRLVFCDFDCLGV